MIAALETATKEHPHKETNQLFESLLRAATLLFAGYFVMGGVEISVQNNFNRVAFSESYPDEPLREIDIQNIEAFLILTLTTQLNSFEQWQLNKKSEKLQLDESIRHAQSSVKLLLSLLQQNIKVPDEVSRPYREVVEKLQQLQPYFLEAATLFFHDNVFPGNPLESSHQQRQLHEKMHLRPEILELIPSGEYLFTPQRKKMLVTLRKMHPGSLLILLATQFSKPLANGTGLYTPPIYRQINEKALHTHLTQQEHFPEDWLQIVNTARYFKAIDQWVRNVSHLTLDELITLMHVMEKDRMRLGMREKS